MVPDVDTGGSEISSRIKITLPDDAAVRLGEMAAAAGEPVARVAGQMVRDGLAGITAAARANGTAPLDELPVARAPWLEPYGGDREWRQLTWGAIIALYGRSRPVGGAQSRLVGRRRDGRAALRLLPLAADARRRRHRPASRAGLPVQSHRVRRQLKEAGGGVTREWKPGPAPDEWH